MNSTSTLRALPSVLQIVGLVEVEERHFIHKVGALRRELCLVVTLGRGVEIWFQIMFVKQSALESNTATFPRPLLSV